jgi:hypothetical protein
VAAAIRFYGTSKLALADHTATHYLYPKNSASDMRRIRAAPSWSARRKWLVSGGVRRRGADIPKT